MLWMFLEEEKVASMFCMAGRERGLINLLLYSQSRHIMIQQLLTLFLFNLAGTLMSIWIKKLKIIMLFDFPISILLL